MQDTVGGLSFFTPLGYQTSSCGYCKGSTYQSASYYVRSKQLLVEHYQMLVDRGWRRSGDVLYKPDSLRSCCPHYTIRLPAKDFKPHRDQRSALNRWNRYVVGGEYIKEAARLYPKSKEDKARQRMGFDLESAVHGCEGPTLRKPPEPTHQFEVTLEPDSFTQEKFELYANYQKNVHNDPPSKIQPSSFKRFLCSSPLKRVEEAVDDTPRRLGSYHQCYRLDGRLIAMSVLDLLPHCVSGVYFIYHSDFEKWSFGKLSALREACLALEGGYQHYYMGYYIHSCPKMTYKNDYRPQYILDLENFNWDPLDDEVRRLLDANKYLSMSKIRNGRESEIKESEEVTDETESTKNTDHDADEASKSTPTPHGRVYLTVDDVESATSGGTTLFNIEFPGMMSSVEVEQQIDLDRIILQLRNGMLVHCEDLVAWGDGSILSPKSINGIVAELVACVGPQVARQMVVDLVG